MNIFGNNRNRVDGSNPYVARYRREIGEPLYNEERIPKRGETRANKNNQPATSRARYGEFLLYVLLQPGEKLEHPRLSSHVKELFGYTEDQWQQVRLRLDMLNIVNFEQARGVYTTATVNIDKLHKQAEAPFIQDRSEILDILEHLPVQGPQG